MKFSLYLIIVYEVKSVLSDYENSSSMSVEDSWQKLQAQSVTVLGHEFKSCLFLNGVSSLNTDASLPFKLLSQFSFSICTKVPIKQKLFKLFEMHMVLEICIERSY